MPFSRHFAKPLDFLLGFLDFGAQAATASAQGDWLAQMVKNRVRLAPNKKRSHEKPARMGSLGSILKVFNSPSP